MPCKPILTMLLLLAAGACGQAGAAQSGAITMAVTNAGFVPDHIKVKKGKPVTLLITRKTDETCAKDIVIDEYRVHTALPLNKEVSVTFTPTKSGELKYGCAMNKMVSGILTVE